ncbi:MAG TPA: serine--tRNA ligase, partial [Burkholderiales bacterium]|nr:serine--tRNA ligase [Burkholderiales bacterium]
MIDIQLLRNDLEGVAKRLATRAGYALDVARFRELEGKRRELQQSVEAAQADRNRIAKEIGQAKAKKQDASEWMQKGEQLKSTLEKSEAELARLRQDLEDFVRVVPNLPHESVPLGDSAGQNVEKRRWGTPRKFDFAPKDHVDVGAALGMLDFETAAKLSGARFVVMKGALSRLHRALAQFMLDTHTQQHGYTEV